MWVLILIFTVLEVIHITCNMGSRDLPDMYSLSPRACGPQALGIHVRQIPPAHVTTYTCAVNDYHLLPALTLIHQRFGIENKVP